MKGPACAPPECAIGTETRLQRSRRAIACPPGRVGDLAHPSEMLLTHITAAEINCQTAQVGSPTRGQAMARRDALRWVQSGPLCTCGNNPPTVAFKSTLRGVPLFCRDACRAIAGPRVGDPKGAGWQFMSAFMVRSDKSTPSLSKSSARWGGPAMARRLQSSLGSVPRATIFDLCLSGSSARENHGRRLIAL